MICEYTQDENAKENRLILIKKKLVLFQNRNENQKAK